MSDHYYRINFDTGAAEDVTDEMARLRERVREADRWFSNPPRFWKAMRPSGDQFVEVEYHVETRVLGPWGKSYE